MLWQLPAPHPVHAGHSLQTAIVPALRITSVADDSNRDTGQGNASKSAPSVMNGTRRCDVWIAAAVRRRHLLIVAVMHLRRACLILAAGLAAAGSAGTPAGAAQAPGLPAHPGTV